MKKITRTYDAAGNVITKECVICGAIKPISEYRQYNGRSTDGHYGCCIVCHRTADNARYAARKARK